MKVSKNMIDKSLSGLSMTIVTRKRAKYKEVNINTDKKLKPTTTKGKGRYVRIGTLNPLFLVKALLPYALEGMDVDMETLFALVSDDKHNVLTSKEACMLIEGIPASKYNKYVAAMCLNKWEQEQSIKEYREHKYTTHNARTSKASNVKHLSDLMAGIVIQLVDTPFGELYEKLVMDYDDETFEMLPERYEMPKRSNKDLQEISDRWFLTLQRNNTPEVERETRTHRERTTQALTFRRLLDKKDRRMDRALTALEFLFPTLKGGQRSYIIDRLYKHFIEGRELNTKETNEVTQVVIEAQGRTENISKEQKEGDKQRGIYGIPNDIRYTSTSLYIYTLTYLLSQPPLTPTTKYSPPPSYVYNPYPCTTLPPTKPSYQIPGFPINTSSLINTYNFYFKSNPHTINTYNTLALKFLSSYEPSNDLERRCKQVMLGTGKAFPISYLRLSTCPRIYAEGKDNLFYCPTPLRHATCVDLGLREWDMKSCHTNILLGLYPYSFPILKGMTERNSIWKEYEEYFTSQACVFNKQVVKRFHYATILGGGTEAYKDSIRKLRNEGIVLTQEEAEELITTYKKHPLVKEMKSFINKWGYNNRKVTYPNGETHKVSLPKASNNKRVNYEESNVLDIFSGLLRAWEMVLISYVGLSHPEAFTILLHQHDGITVVEHENNAFDLAQGAMQEISKICFPNLSKPIELEIKL